MVAVLQLLLIIASLNAGSSVAASGQLDDALLRMKTKVALLTSADVRARDISVDVADAAVTLQGTVATERHKSRAGAVAASIDGVKRVENLLRVVPAPSKRAATVSDEAIETAVKRAFSIDVLVKPSNIGVRSVRRGVVVLEGRTRSLATHLRALELTHAVDGVGKVTSRVEVSVGS
jgi:osmotically-inducible protein OsmY